MPKPTKQQSSQKKSQSKKNRNKNANKSVQQAASRAIRKELKGVARESGIAVLSGFVGEDTARSAYRVANTISKAVKPQKRGKRLVLSSVASLYLKSYISPFDASVRSAHIPTTPSYPTYKCMGFTRGTAYIGLSGVGWLAVAPTIANDAPSVYYTTAAFGLSNLSQPPSNVSTTTGGATYPAVGMMSNLPFSSAQITATSNGSKIEGRLVSVSLRLQYTGTELNRSGMIYAYSDPDGDNTLGASHTDITNGSGYYVDGLATREATEITQVTRNYTQLLILPPNSYSIDFTNQNASLVRQVYPYSTGDNITFNAQPYGAAPAAIMITGKPGESLYYEVVYHVEYEGAGVTQSLMTSSDSDVVGLDAVQNILSKAQRMNASDGQTTFQKSLKKVMKEEGVVFGDSHRSVDY